MISDFFFFCGIIGAIVILFASVVADSKSKKKFKTDSSKSLLAFLGDDEFHKKYGDKSPL